MNDNNDQSIQQPARAPADHPDYRYMVTLAIHSLKERQGSSRRSIRKFIEENYKVDDKCDQRVKSVLKRGVAKGWLVHVSGKGSAACFRL